MSVEVNEKGVTRRHTFFCLDRARHSDWASKVVDVVPKNM